MITNSQMASIQMYAILLLLAGAIFGLISWPHMGIGVAITFIVGLINAWIIGRKMRGKVRG